MSQFYLFLGHVATGCSMFCIAFFWCINIFKDFYVSKYGKGQPYLNQPWYPIRFFRRVPLDSLIKLLFSAMFMAIIAIATQSVFFIYHPINLIHFEIVAAIFLNGLCDTMKYNNVHFLPDGIEAASAIFMFLQEAFLFNVHIMGRNSTDVFLHTILVYISLATALVVFLETLNRHSPMLSLARTFLLQLQGTWFLQICAILFPPWQNFTPSVENTPSVVTIAAVFIVHAISNFVFIILIGCMVGQYMKKRGRLVYFTVQESIANSKSSFDAVQITAPLLSRKCEIPTDHPE